MAKNNTLQVLWFGVTPIIPLSERHTDLIDKIGEHYMTYPNYTGGMENYSKWRNYVPAYDVIATDEEKIDPSWESFFTSENSGKKIYQWTSEGWQELKSGFSK